TDERMTRFWITLRQGVAFVIDSIEMMQGGEVFVPKLPSMKIADLARAICPECEIEPIGIRSGEKLHESMISVDESRTAVDLGDRFAILPANPHWGSVEYPGGTKLPEGFSYSSDSNDDWLDASRLLEMIKD
ncbi:MAG: polysaccharide biosynthesis protein, partial [Bdellovibrionales bacterium]|nr:polysaccharide biosynthesis protein [Bdellovibrionales bacterium]